MVNKCNRCGRTNMSGGNGQLCALCIPRKHTPMPKINIPYAIMGIAAILAALAILVYGSVAVMRFFGWTEGIFAPLRGISSAHETDDYFRRHGERVDFLFEDIDAVSIKINEISVYKIEVREMFQDDRGWSTMQRDIIFEQNEGVIKIEVKPEQAPDENRRGTSDFYDRVFAEIDLLPFGTYHIITEDGERYILTENPKSAVRAADNPALYDKLMSFSIERIIDFEELKRNDLSCFEAGRVREYSTADKDMGHLGYAGMFLREYESTPGGYLMKYHADDILHEIRAMFFYSKVNSKIPRISDYR